MTHVIAAVAVAPLRADPDVRAEQVSQLVLGETARAVETAGDWRRLQSTIDQYDGWCHRGYLHPVDEQGADRWHQAASGWSTGAWIDEAGATVAIPLRARVVLADEELALPNGRIGRFLTGSVDTYDQVGKVAREVSPDRWALEYFAGAPYQWGGVTPWGVDCSGLVQTTFLARGIPLPRDARDQATSGESVAGSETLPGDLLLFDLAGDGIDHIALAAKGETLVHATIDCGGVVAEPWGNRTRAAFMRDRLVDVRRIAGA